LEVRVSQLELTADFDLPLDALAPLASWLRIRWAKRIGTRGLPPKATHYWGDRMSRCETKLYFKEERGASFIRLEHTFRRDYLRDKGVNRLEDLARHNWGRTGKRRAEWVELDLDQVRRLRDERVALRNRVFAEGLKPVLDSLSPNKRRWVMEHLKPLPIQTNLEAAFAQIAAPVPVGMLA
jgi:hypothetical protein